jgi:hypothetical protein
MGNRIPVATLKAAIACAALCGCSSIGPQALQDTRLQYNEVVKVTNEEQLLLNIVRLRYGETPSSLQVSAIAAQFERTQSAGVTPFFAASGADVNRSFTAVLPTAQFGAADRPTMSLTPLDDQDFTRKLFTPMTLDGIVYLAKTTWPIATVFRLYLENLNWISNAQTASGPTPKYPPDVDDFLRGITAMQSMQDRGQIVFALDDRTETVAGPIPLKAVSARDVLEAAKAGFEYRMDEKGTSWTLVKKSQAPVLLVDPQAGYSPDLNTFTKVFGLKPGITKYDITQDTINPFPSQRDKDGVATLDLETRSLLQALYYVSHGIEIPPEHSARGLVTITTAESGTVYDWPRMMRGLFHVKSVLAGDRPTSAQIAVRYRGYWFYIDDTDQESKSTFSLLLQVSRLELAGKPGPGPVLTLPVGGH